MKEQLDRIIDREIYTLANGVMAALCEQNDCWTDHAENMDKHVCPECGEEVNAEVCENDEETGDYICPHCSERFDSPEYESKEIYRWFMVSDWLAERLKAHGEAVYEEHDVAFWGRTGCGYALTVEPCLVAIAKEIAS